MPLRGQLVRTDLLMKPGLASSMPYVLVRSWVSTTCGILVAGACSVDDVFLNCASVGFVYQCPLRAFAAPQWMLVMESHLLGEGIMTALDPR